MIVISLTYDTAHGGGGARRVNSFEFLLISPVNTPLPSSVHSNTLWHKDTNMRIFPNINIKL